jgi:hypothetical protein
MLHVARYRLLTYNYANNSRLEMREGQKKVIFLGLLVLASNNITSNISFVLFYLLSVN